MHLRVVVTLGFTVVLILAVAPTDSAARRRHHHHPSPAQVDTGQKAAAAERISPNPRAARMRQAEDALQKATTSDPVASAGQTPGALRDPKTRAQVTAALAVATLPRADLAAPRHRDGGYGWVGPVFWPFAGFDLFDAALWGDAVDPTLWSYGSGDLTAGLLGIYPDDAITAYTAYLPSATTTSPQPSMLARMCGDVKGADIAGQPVDGVRAGLALDAAQRAALDDLADAMLEASQRIADTCPDTLPLTAQQRLATMRHRVEAMIGAADMIAPPLAAFYARLNDGQKEQFAALGAPPVASAPQASPPAAGSVASPSAAAQACAAAQAPPSATQLWPQAALERAIRPGEAARKALDGLRVAVTSAPSQLASSCQPAEATTPPARLAAIKVRLAAMRDTLASLEGALTPVYAALDPVQTVDFDGAGAEPARAAAIAAAVSRASQSAALAPPAEADNQAAASPAERHGHGRRHLVRYAHRIPGPVHVIGRVLGALLP